MKSSLRSLIPPKFRQRGGWVVVTIFLRALLNFLGLALLVPVLTLILDTQAIHQIDYLDQLYRWGGFSSDNQFVTCIALGVVLLIVLKNLLALGLYRTERNYIYSLYRYLSRNLYTTYYRRGLHFIKQSNSAVLARNVNVVSFSFVAGVLRPLATMACEATLFLLLFGAVLLYSPKAAGLVLLIFLPTVIVYYRLVRRRLNRYGEVENRAHREKARVVMETFRGYSEVEINRAFPLMLKRFDKAMDEIVEVQQKNATLGQLPSLFTETGLALGMALLVIFSLRGETGDIRLLFGVFAVAALRLMPSVRSLMSGWAAIKYNRYTIDILREAQIESEQQNKEDAERMGLQQAIRIEGLTFCFEDSPEKPLIENLSLTIHKGERIGIRGESGRGKTTLFNLLLGFYPPTQGRIWIDDTPLTPENRRRWQNSVGYVSQNVFLTDSTFAANVALGETEDRIDRERVRQALEQAQLLPFIDSLPEGMETPIGECGCRISGGQRQRIGIARALYKGADVLLLDEATSSLDNRTEEGINRSIEALSKGNSDLTIIVIAHRETSLSYCDRIIEM